MLHQFPLGQPRSIFISGSVSQKDYQKERMICEKLTFIHLFTQCCTGRNNRTIKIASKLENCENLSQICACARKTFLRIYARFDTIFVWFVLDTPTVFVVEVCSKINFPTSRGWHAKRQIILSVRVRLMVWKRRGFLDLLSLYRYSTSSNHSTTVVVVPVRLLFSLRPCWHRTIIRLHGTDFVPIICENMANIRCIIITPAEHKIRKNVHGTPTIIVSCSIVWKPSSETFKLSEFVSVEVCSKIIKFPAARDWHLIKKQNLRYENICSPKVWATKSTNFLQQNKGIIQN